MAVRCLPFALVLAACVLLGAEAQSCVGWRGTLGRTESDVYVEAVMGVLGPFFSGTVFLPPEAAVSALQAANSSLSATDILQYHLVPSLSPVDASVNSSRAIAVKTLLDSNDNPTICPDNLITETTLTFDASATRTTVNGIAADLASARDACDGYVVPIAGVLLPRCLTFDGAVPLCKAPSTFKALSAMNQTAAALLAKLLSPKFEGTVFVPSNAALKALFANLSLPFPPPATSANATAFLSDIVLYHAIPSAALTPPSQAPPAATLRTALATAPSQSLCRTPPAATLAAAGPPLTITPAASAPITPAAADATPTCRGVIYAIDSVLLPCALEKAWLVAPTPVPNPSPAATVSPTARSAPVPATNSSSRSASPSSSAATSRTALQQGGALALLLAAAVALLAAAV